MSTVGTSQLDPALLDRLTRTALRPPAAEIIAGRKAESACIDRTVAAEAHPGIGSALIVCTGRGAHSASRECKRLRDAPCGAGIIRPGGEDGPCTYPRPSVLLPHTDQLCGAWRRSSSLGVGSPNPARRAAPGPVNSIRTPPSGGWRSRPVRTASAADPEALRRAQLRRRRIRQEQPATRRPRQGR